MNSKQNICAIHQHQKTHICLNRSCSNGFKLICPFCCKQLHSQHKNKLITIENFIQKLNNLKIPPMEANNQLTLFDLYNKVSLLRNFRSYILDKETLLFLGNYSIKQTLKTINQEQVMIDKQISQLKSYPQVNSIQFQKSLQESRDILQINLSSGNLIVSNGKIKRNEQKIHDLILQSLVFVGDLREYLVKIIQVLMDQAEEQEMQKVKGQKKDGTIQQYLNEMFIQEESMLQKQIKNKLEILYKINPINPLFQQLMIYNQKQIRVECPESETQKINKKCEELEQDLRIFNHEKQQLRKIVQEKQQINLKLNERIKNLQVNKRHVIMEICQEIANLKCQIEIIGINTNAIKQQFIEMVSNQVEQYVQNCNNNSQTINNLKNILNCEEQKILQRIKYYFQEFNCLINQKDKIIQQNQILKQQSESFHDRILLNLANTAELQQKNNLLAIQLEIQKEKERQMKNTIKTINQINLELNEKNNCLNSKIMNLEIVQKNQKLQKKNYKEKFNQSNSLNISYLSSQHQTQKDNNLSMYKNQDSLLFTNQSILKRRLSKETNKNCIQVAIDCYKTQASQKLSILKDSLKAKQLVINTQKEHIQRLSHEKGKSIQKNRAIQKQDLKNKLLLKNRQEKIKQLSLVNQNLQKNQQKIQYTIKQLQKNNIKLKDQVKRLEQEKAEVLNQLKQQKKQIYSLEQQMKIYNCLLEKEDKNFDSETPTKNRKQSLKKMAAMKISILTSQESNHTEQNPINEIINKKQQNDQSNIRSSEIHFVKTSRVNRKSISDLPINDKKKQQYQTVKRLMMTVSSDVNALQTKMLIAQKIQNAYQRELQKKTAENRKLKTELALSRRQLLQKKCNLKDQQFNSCSSPRFQ